MINNRQSVRLRQQFSLYLYNSKNKIIGEATVLNVSDSGMLLMTDMLVKPEEGLIVNFSGPGVPCMPPEGKVAWCTRVKNKTGIYRCGIMFLPQSPRMSLWQKWMKENYNKLGAIEDKNIHDRLLA